MPGDPAGDLRDLFRERDRIKREAADVDARLARARRAYCDANGLSVVPHDLQLRHKVGA